MLPVSVIIPTYNREKTISRAVHSVIKQTTSCSEIIIVDDGSDDNSLDVLDDLFSHKNIPHSIIGQTNKGPAAARNFGITRARYPYIAFLDSDDHWTKRKLEIQYQAMRENIGIVVSHTKEKWLRRGVHLNQKKIHIPKNGNIFHHCLKLCAVGMSTVMIKTQLFDEIGLFDESLRCCEDYDFWLRVSSRYEFKLVDSQLTIKEGGRDDQVSHIYRLGMDKFRLYALKKILTRGELAPHQHLLALEEFERKSEIYGNGCIKHGKLETGKQVLKELAEQKHRSSQQYPSLKNNI